LIWVNLFNRKTCHYTITISALFLAYVNGAARLCRELLRAGGCLATVNKYGTSVFNAEVPTKKLLFSLLGKFTLSLHKKITLVLRAYLHRLVVRRATADMLTCQLIFLQPNFWQCNVLHLLLRRKTYFLQARVSFFLTVVSLICRYARRWTSVVWWSQLSRMFSEIYCENKKTSLVK